MGRPKKPWSGVAALPSDSGGGDCCGTYDGRDGPGWPRRGLALLVVTVVLWCGWQVLPERVARLHEFAADQHARSAEAAPLPNRGERWIVDMERMALAWLAPGDRVAVWSPQAADRIPTNQFDRMRLGYVMAPEPLWRSEDTVPDEVDWVYSSRAVSLAMEQAGWTGFEPVVTPRAHRLYRRIGGRADGREALTETESGLPDGGPPLGVQVVGTVAAMAAAWLGGWLLLLAWSGRGAGAGTGSRTGRWRQLFVGMLVGQLAVAAGMLVANGAGLGGERVAVMVVVGLTVASLALAGRAWWWMVERGWVRSAGCTAGLSGVGAGAGAGAGDAMDGGWGKIGRVEGWLLAGLGLLMVVAGGWAAVCWHTNCLPGMGIWAHKAKLFFLAGGFPDGYFAEPGWSTSQPGYPLVTSLLMQWGYVWTGAVADRAVGLWNAVWLAVACVWVMAWLRGARTPVVVVWLVVPLLFLNGELARQWFERYADPLFLLHAVVGLGLVAGAIARWNGLGQSPSGGRTSLLAGMFLVASTAWVKHEGVWLTLVSVAALSLVVIQARGFRRGWIWSCAAAGWLVVASSWLLAGRWLGAGAGSYDLGRPATVTWAESQERLVLSWRAWREFALFDGAQLAGIWWMVPPLLIFGLWRARRHPAGWGRWEREPRAGWSVSGGWLVTVAAGYTIGLGTIYLFSTQPFPWAMTASLTRGLILPTLVLTMAALTTLADGRGRSQPLTKVFDDGT